MIIKVFVLDTNSSHVAYSPPKVTGLLNLDQIVSVIPYTGRSTEHCSLVTLTKGDPLIVCMTANELFTKIDSLRLEALNK